MKLLYSPTSPYVRKVRVLAIERGLADRIELVTAVPWPDPAPVVRDNPLGKVPVLVTDDGFALYDSPVICEYLDSIASGSALIPAAGIERWRVLRCQALADGILDAAVAVVLERRRPAPEQSAAGIRRSLDAIHRAVATLAGELKSTHEFDLGQIALAVALGYLDFRLGEIDFGAGAPAIRDWWANVSERPSLVSTRPV
jgi:glutathione S-transferase